MKIGEYIRNKTFKAIDALRRDSIQKYVKELQHFEAKGHDYTVVQKKLNGLLSSAQSSSPFYKNKMPTLI